MVLKAQLGEQPVTLSLKPSALTVALDEQTVLAFDRAGRLWSFFTHEHHFRRGLNGSILAKWTADRPLALPARASERQRRRLWHSEADLVVRRAAQIARRLADRLQFLSLIHI